MFRLENQYFLFLLVLSAICLNSFTKGNSTPKEDIIELSVLGHNIKIINFNKSNELTTAYIQNHSDSIIPSANVTAYFTNSLNSTGWSILEITSTQSPNVESSRNHRLNRTQEGIQLGMLEGALTAELIDSAYNNYFHSVLEGQEITPTQQAFVNNQTAWMRKKIRLNQQDRYWQMAGFMLGQLQGMYAGYLARRMEEQTRDPTTTDVPILTFEHFYYLTNMGDLEDIQNAFTQTNKTEMNCDAYVKITQDDLICAHNTFNIYSLMLRVYKIYNVIIPQVDLHKPSFQGFSSRPGDLESKDDFYILNSGLVVMETSLNNYNKSNYDYLHYDSVPCWMRVNIANRLATTANEWAAIFELHRSGTHNNQWLIVDYNAWRNKQSTKDVVVLMVEESFSLYKVCDFTETLLTTGYVASYNVPYNQEIYNQTMYTSGYGFNYTDDPRAVLFRDLSPYANDTAAVMQLIRSNNNITGDVSNAISPRYDLLPSGAYTFGGIDGKVVNNELLSLGQALMISGPSTDGLPVFDWTNWEDVPHESMPNRYDFEWIVYQPQNHSYTRVSGQQVQEIVPIDLNNPEIQEK